MATKGRKRVKTGPSTLLNSEGKEVFIGIDDLSANASMVSDLHTQQLLKQVVTQLKIISKKLNCLTQDNEDIDEDELNEIEND